MEDTHIVQMYWDRNETAISESAMKYGTYCTSIAQNILQNPADAKVTDTFSCMTMLQTIFLSRIVTSRLVRWRMRRPVCGRRFLTNG